VICPYSHTRWPDGKWPEEALIIRSLSPPFFLSQ
jgi:hypothetical protein